MPFNVADFNSEIAKSGFAAPSQFEGLIMGGPGTQYGNGSGILNAFGLDQGMRFRIEALNMPGRTLTTIDQQYHGPVRAIPYRFTVQPVSITVILSRDMRERELFMRWQDYFVGHYRTNYNNLQSQAQFDTKYYDDGIGEMHIWQWSNPLKENNSEKPVVQNEIRLMECYPLNIHDLSMSWSDDGYSKLQVEMKYRYATERYIPRQNNTAFELESNNKLYNRAQALI